MAHWKAITDYQRDVLNLDVEKLQDKTTTIVDDADNVSDADDGNVGIPTPSPNETKKTRQINFFKQTINCEGQAGISLQTSHCT